MRTTTAVLAAFLIAHGTNAQTPAERLARAIVIEENEHDPGQAIALYRALAKDAGAEAAIRDEAGLRLGVALRRLGQSDQANAVLQALASAGGPLAPRAQAALQDPDDTVGAAIREKVAAFERSAPDLALHNELVLLGEKAVPELLRAAKTSVNRGAWLVGVVLRIGGKPVVDWLETLAERGDVKDCKIVFEAMRNTPIEDPVVLAALQAFLRHDDAEVRANALDRLCNVIPARRVIDMTDDDEPLVRMVAWRSIVNWGALRHESGERASLEQLAPHLQRVLSGAHPEDLQFVFQFLDLRKWVAIESGPRLYLRALRLPTYSPNSSGVFDFSRGDVQPDELAEDVAETIRVLGPVDVTPAIGRSSPTPRQRALNGFLAGLLPYWTDASRDTALALIASGYEAPNLVSYVQRHARRDDIPQIARDMRRVPGLVEGLLQWMAQAGVPPAAFTPLREYVDDMLAGRLPKVSWIVTALGTIDNEQSTAYLHRLAFERDRCDLAVSGLLQGKSDSSRVVLRDLLVLDSDHPAYARMKAASYEEVGLIRARILQHLVDLADEATIDLLPKAYESGLQATNISWDHAVHSCRGLGTVLSAKLERWSERVYDDDQIARAIDLCLTTKRGDVWEDLFHTQGWPSLGESALGVVARHALESPGSWRVYFVEQLLHTLGEVDRATLAAAILTDPDQGPVPTPAGPKDLRQLVIDAIAQKQVDLAPLAPVLQELAKKSLTAPILRMFARVGDARHAAFVRSYLTAGDREVRRAAADALIELTGSKAADDLLPLLESGAIDEDAELLSGVARRLLDRRFVPLLLAAMRRPDADHAQLKQALEAIRFYDEQTAHWQRVLDGTNVDASSAAEALLKQARPDSARDIRLLAIPSLGALGAPEALPFLIDYSQDPDAEIAAAAKAAITQIQLAKRPGK